MMTTAIMTVVLATQASTGCYLASSSRAGWVRVELPKDVPTLSAPEGMQQFRTGEPVMVYINKNPRDVDLCKAGLGKRSFDFPLTPQDRFLAVRFAEPLHGAKVDVHLRRPGWRWVLLMDERRIKGNSLQVSWEMEGTELGITVHNHARHDPVVLQQWRVGRMLVPSASSSGPFDTMDLPSQRTLYFLVWDQTDVLLCPDPAVTMWVEESTLSGDVQTASLQATR